MTICVAVVTLQVVVVEPMVTVAVYVVLPVAGEVSWSCSVWPEVMVPLELVKAAPPMLYAGEPLPEMEIAGVPAKPVTMIVAEYTSVLVGCPVRLLNWTVGGPVSALQLPFT